MTKEIKKYYSNFNFLEEVKKSFINPDIFTPYHIDGSFKGNSIDITNTSGNLDFEFSTRQTYMENVYCNCNLYDFKTGEYYNIGYIYFKNYTGKIDENILKVMTNVCYMANTITERIFKDIG